MNALHTEERSQRPASDDARTRLGTPVTEPREDALMSETAKARWGAAIVAIAPAVMAAGFVYHPHLSGTLPNNTAVAEAVAADTTRWAVAHLAVGVGSGLLILAFLAIRSYLREAGEERWSVLALPFIVIGSTLYALLPAMEFAPLAAVEIGADAAAAQGALGQWFLPILLTSAVVFTLGAAGFAVALARSEVLSPQLTWLVVGMLVVMAAARFVPLSAVQLYLQGAAGIVALWPLAYVMWKHAETQLYGQPERAPAT